MPPLTLRTVALGVSTLAVFAAGVTAASVRSADPRPLIGLHSVAGVPHRQVATAGRSTLQTTRPAPARTASLYPLPSDPVYPQPCPPPPYNPPPPTKRGAAAVSRGQLPDPLRRLHTHPSLHAIRDKGMWITTWPSTPVRARQWVQRAVHHDVHQLWVRTGGSNDGWYGGHLLKALLPRAHRHGISVIAWDFPTLSNPVADAQRAARATQGRWAGERIDGFSPDLETKSEGVFNSKIRVRVYLSRVRHTIRHRPLIATVYRPTDYWWNGAYPYRAEAPYVDAFAPMVYWSCDEPGADTKQAVRRLRQLRPVHPIGQAYDMGAYGGRQGLPTGKEIWRFLDVAWRNHAVGASLYTWNTANHTEWRSLHKYPWTRR